MSITVEIDTRQFERAIETYSENSRRSVTEVINRACVDIIINAAKETPKSTKQNITASLLKEVSSTSVKGSKAVTRQAQLIYLILNARNRKTGNAKGLNNAQMAAAAAKLIKRRVASVGYIAYAGWNPALQAFGGRGFGHGAKKPDGVTTSNAESGFGLRAIESKMIAQMVNCATNAARIGAEPFQRVMDSKALDMVNHIAEKLAEQAKNQR